MSQVLFLDKYSGYEHKHKELTNQLSKKQSELRDIERKKKALNIFISSLENREGLIEEWDEQLMNYFVDEMVVKKNNSIDFKFKDGKVINIALN